MVELELLACTNERCDGVVHVYYYVGVLVWCDVVWCDVVWCDVVC